jgi:nucleotide-binding universal stress UspA family protein
MIASATVIFCERCPKGLCGAARLKVSWVAKASRWMPPLSAPMPIVSVRHLARHGAKVEVEQVSSLSVPTGRTILDAAAAGNADLIVMGAHSHSRSSHLLFGSVTRSILKDTTVPVLYPGEEA